MEKEKNPVEEVEAMLQSVPPRNILITFDGKTTRSLESYKKERDKTRSKPKKSSPER